MWNKAAAVACTMLVAAVASAMTFDEWSQAVNVETIPGTHPNFNTSAQDGCPAPSRDGLAMYMASTRPGGQGGIDIWVAKRESADDPWGEPTNVGEPINTPADEFCPTPLRNGHDLLFVSTKPGGCGGADIYVARTHVKRGWSNPLPLGCAINSAGDEASPFLIDYDDGRSELYFSSTRAGGFSADPPGATRGDADIYVSALVSDGTLVPPILADGVNTASNDVRPNLRRDGLEIFFDSDRPSGLGGLDIWSSVRSTTLSGWLLPENPGDRINSTANETRPFVSWDGSALYFGSNRAGVEGVVDIFVATRQRRTGKGVGPR